MTKFPMNRLAVAILMICSSYSLAYAQDNAEVELETVVTTGTIVGSSADDKLLEQTASTLIEQEKPQAETVVQKQVEVKAQQVNEIKQQNEQYAGQSFFERYYQPNSELTKHIDNKKITNFNRFCQGTWVTPVSAKTPTADLEDSETIIHADYGYYNPIGDSELIGDVQIEQMGRKIRADKVTIDPTQTYATVQGRVEMAQNGIVAQSDSIRYNLKQQIGDLESSYYVSEQTHAHGYAQKISRPNANEVILQDASYSACAPSEAPTWKIKAKEIKLNQETGRGVTKGTKLYIKNTPVMAVPYFNFPIDDRRTTGLLSPSFGYTNGGGVQVATPVYLNLAPNYDATITPRIMTDRGVMLDGEFRYLTENFGRGQLWGGYLPSDRKYGDKRADFHAQHDWQINPQFHLSGEYNYASDKDFFSDLSQNTTTHTDLNLRRALRLNYANGIDGLTAQLKAESFQTLDKDVSDEKRPYARLPQFLLNYVKGNDVKGWQFEYNNDTAYFKKNVRDMSVVETSGTRFYNSLALRYNYYKPYGFIVPSIGVRSINTWYDQDSLASRNLTKNDNNSVVVPQFTLDMGLNFERQGKFLQQISPRAFYAYSGYKNQTDNPNFDTTTASISYDQLFSPTRFYGHDRLDDNNFLSLGVNYRLFDEIGLERLRAGVGQSFFFEDRRVTLRDVETERRTGPIVSIGSQFTDKISVNANSAWTSAGSNAQRDIQIYYTGEQGNLYNLGYFNRQEIQGRQSAYDQAMFSFIQPVKDNWRVMGHVQYDIDNSVWRDMLVGVNYESCCWGVSVYGRSYYNDLDDPNSPDAKANRAVMAEFTLKGLGGFNNKFNSLLESRVLGFNKMNQMWTQR